MIYSLDLTVTLTVRSSWFNPHFVLKKTKNNKIPTHFNAGGFHLNVSRLAPRYGDRLQLNHDQG